MATHTTGASATKTIALPLEMASQADARRKRLRLRSFSAYVQILIDQDLARGGPLLLGEDQPAVSVEARAHAALNDFGPGVPLADIVGARVQLPPFPKRAA